MPQLSKQQQQPQEYNNYKKYTQTLNSAIVSKI